MSILNYSYLKLNTMSVLKGSSQSKVTLIPHACMANREHVNLADSHCEVIELEATKAKVVEKAPPKKR
jgi:hypothetical protein